MATKQQRQRNVLGRAASPRTLWSAWSRVAGGSGVPGVDGISTSQYARDVGANLDVLGRHLRTGSYQAQPVRQILHSRNGKQRVLGVPTVRDRVAQRAFLEVLRRRLDAELSEVSFAYRRGRSWLDALRRAEAAREEGLRWVFRGDIASYLEGSSHCSFADCRV